MRKVKLRLAPAMWYNYIFSNLITTKAAIRAIETEKSPYERLFYDAMAHILAGNAISYVKGIALPIHFANRLGSLSLQQKREKQQQNAEQQEYWNINRPYLIVRTKWFDDALSEAVMQCNSNQVQSCFAFCNVIC